jgi:Cu/Ag efflux protein CusF
MTKRSLLFCTALLSIPALLQAHTHKSLMGTVKAMDSTRIELTLKNGKVQSIPLAKSTMIMRGSEMVGADQVKTGMRVVVVLAEDDRTAENIKIPAAHSTK